MIGDITKAQKGDALIFPEEENKCVPFFFYRDPLGKLI